MKAVVVDPEAPRALRFSDVPEPVAGPDQLVMEVHSFALNPGELHWAANLGARSDLFAFAPGTIIGHETAGVVVEAAGNGQGPTVGTRVVGMMVSGGWAERRAVDVNKVAAIPDGLEDGIACTAPIAGGVAFTAISQAGPLVGRRVLVTGAGGGTGRFVVQLAHLSGARLVASVRNADRIADVKRLGADEVVLTLSGLQAPFDAVIDCVGGPDLLVAWDLLGQDGHLVIYGWASFQATELPPFAIVGPIRRHLHSVSGDVDAHTTKAVLDLMALGKIDPQIAQRADWTDLHAVVDNLLTGKVHGKAVLDITRTPSQGD